MDIQPLRHSLKIKWLLYYRQNRPWLIQLKIWGTYEGQRRPSSSFILATLSTLEPQFTQMLPFIVALSNDPDQIVAALGLNFNPDEELKSLTEPTSIAKTNSNGNGVMIAPSLAKTNGNTVIVTPPVQTNGNGLAMQMPSSVADQDMRSPSTQTTNLPNWVDESCTGRGTPNPGVALSILVMIGSLAVWVIGFTG
ncbi:MAG: DUF5331 domain-containing protein [Gloeocapsa sp. UFS-A4-WI-NPMV-4B04]|nr:DUF5331 domain-containing protein [Gloeocapsa sp. UFS-A4-WI-NPMV-4B04]